MFFVWLMTVGIQVGFIYFVREAIDPSAVEDDSFTMLAYSAIATLVASVQGGEIRECQDILQWVRMWPGSGDPEKPRFAFRRKHLVQSGQTLDYWVPEGYISCSDRIVFFVLLVMRLSIALIVMFFGAVLILESDDTEDQILNT